MKNMIEYIVCSKVFWILTFITVVYVYLKFIVFNYFSRKRIPHLKPTLLIGNALEFITGQKSLGVTLQKSYEKFKKYPIHGFYIFFEPIVIINDLKLIGSVLIKDFHHFLDRFSDDLDFDPMLDHLFCERGKKWRNNRIKLSPAFTARKLKEMFHLLDEIGENLKKHCQSMANNSEIIELKDLAARFTTDTIATLAYGCMSNSIENPNAEFRLYGKEIFDGHPIKVLLVFFAPIVLKLLQMRFIKKKVGDYFTRIFKEVVIYRRENNVMRKDFVSLLMELMDNGFIEDNEEMTKSSVANVRKMTLNEASGQSFVFFAAGFETSSSLITYCLYELAINTEIQEKLRSEIKNVLSSQLLTYDSIGEMLYLEKVLSETLRMYPAVPLLSRTCVRSYKVPGTNFSIQKGMKVIIPILGIHFNSDIYPEPEKFNPERFNLKNIMNRHPLSYMPFGEGPRMCIGKRLGLIQTKIVLIKMLMNYKFSICEKTEIPTKHSTRTFVLTPEKGVYLRIKNT